MKAAICALLLVTAVAAAGQQDHAARLAEAGCPALTEATGSALISISGKDFTGRAAVVAEGRAIALGEPDGRCLIFAARDPDGLIGAADGSAEMNVIGAPDAPPPENTRAPLLLVSVLDPPLDPFLATRGTLHLRRGDTGIDATFRLELHHGEVRFTVFGRFSIPPEE